MNKTLTKKILRNAAIKRTAMYQAIVYSIPLVAFSIIFIVTGNDRSAIESILYALALTSGIFLFTFLILLLGKGRIAKFITMQERVLQVSFEEEMAKEGIYYKNFRVYDYINENWYIYGGNVLHRKYIVNIDASGRDMRAQGNLSMIIKGISVEGKSFRIVTDDSGYEEFMVWYAKVNPDDPFWRRQVGYRPRLEGRGIPEGWMAPKKAKKGDQKDFIPTVTAASQERETVHMQTGTVTSKKSMRLYITWIAPSLVIAIMTLASGSINPIFFILLALALMFVVIMIVDLMKKVEVSAQGVKIGNKLLAYSDISHVTISKHRITITMTNNKQHRVNVTNDIELADAIEGYLAQRI